jgi:hypothetical protein
VKKEHVPQSQVPSGWKVRACVGRHGWGVKRERDVRCVQRGEGVVAPSPPLPFSFCSPKKDAPDEPGMPSQGEASTQPPTAGS